MGEAVSFMPSMNPGQLRGALRIEVARRSSGESFIRDQFFCAPFHLSKPYWTGSLLLINVVNPTAGLFSGDQLHLEVTVRAGASVLLTAAAAARAHSSGDRFAGCQQIFKVEQAGWLEVYPELFIPQAESRFRQETEIQLEEGAEMFFVETLAPGRVASAESFEFFELSWRTGISYAGKLSVLEQFNIKPDDEVLRPLRKVFPQFYLGNCFLMTKRTLPVEIISKIAALHQHERVRVGITKLRSAGYVIKVMARDTLALSSALLSIRALLSEIFPNLAVSPRKN
ncbi:MAG: ureD [Verrucomicrobiales bacterium]|nr:ureD [Verrucomicrobiales bacterium]